MKIKPDGIALLVIGIIGLMVVYYMRPPSGWSETIMMLGQGRKYYINEPLYEILLLVAALFAVCGVFLIVKDRKKA